MTAWGPLGMMVVSIGLSALFLISWHLKRKIFFLWFGAAFTADALGSLGNYLSVNYLFLLGRLVFGGLALTGVVLIFLKKREKTTEGR